jgi:hypothetical protein
VFCRTLWFRQLERATVAYDFRHVAELVPGYREPTSPFMLLQECVPNTAWHQASAPIFVCADRAKTHYAAWDFFARFSSAREVISAKPWATLASGHVTARQSRELLRMAGFVITHQYPSGDWAIPGLAPYIYESFQVFQLNNLRVSPTDPELAKYVHWRLTCASSNG